MTPTCRSCRRPIPAGYGRLYCSPRCRQTAYRRRHTPTVQPAPLLPARSRREHTIYLCPTCDTRTLGEQRCPDCNTFTRRLGLGGHCPYCDEPVSIKELLEMPLDNT